MPLFSAQDITWMQNLAGIALTDDCDILYNSNTSGNDSQGGKTAATSSVRATVKCAVIDHGLMGLETYVNAQQRGHMVKDVLLPAGTTVLDSDRLRVNSAVYYEVIECADPTTDEIVRRVVVKKLGQGGS